MLEKEFKSAAAFRRWLSKNHDKCDELWLVYYKKGSGEMSVTYEESVCEALCYGWIDGLLKRVDEKRCKRRFTPRKSRSAWSPTNKKRVAKLIAEGRMQPPGMEKIQEAKANGKWDEVYPTEARKNVRMPAALRAAIDANAKAAAFYETLAPSYRKQYIHWVTTAKREQTRQQRITAVVTALEKHEKP